MRKYLFDFDGTLVDSMQFFVSAMLEILEEEGIPYGEDIIKVITPLGNCGIARYFRELGVSRSQDELLDRMLQKGIQNYENLIPAKESVPETLRKMRERGDRLNILTASPHILLDPCLKRLGLCELFDHVWSCEDFETSKTDPNIYRMAAEQIGAPIGEIRFVDDNYNADKAAKEAGMIVYGIFDESSREYETQIRAITDGYVYRFEELLSLP